METCFLLSFFLFLFEVFAGRVTVRFPVYGSVNVRHRILGTFLNSQCFSLLCKFKNFSEDALVPHRTQ